MFCDLVVPDDGLNVTKLPHIGLIDPNYVPSRHDLLLDVTKLPHIDLIDCNNVPNRHNLSLDRFKWWPHIGIIDPNWVLSKHELSLDRTNNIILHDRLLINPKFFNMTHFKCHNNVKCCLSEDIFLLPHNPSDVIFWNSFEYQKMIREGMVLDRPFSNWWLTSIEGKG